jgi:hypothetical protein
MSTFEAGWINPLQNELFQSSNIVNKICCSLKWNVIMETKEWITLAASLGALLFSLLNYRRNSRFDNENYLYRQKVEAYSKILAELNKLIDEISDEIVLAKLHLANPTEESNIELSKAADEIDQVINTYDHIFISNSLLIPEAVLKPLEQFSDFLLNSDLTIEEDEMNSVLIEKIDIHFDELLAKANALNELMRKDLHIERLNGILYKRLK